MATSKERDFTCCDNPPERGDSAADEGGTSKQSEGSLQLFKDFMAEANKPGRIDARHKKLMAIVLAIAHRCEPCLHVHLDGARKMGIPKAEIDEAAGLAISFGGCTALVFYQEGCKKAGLDS